MNPFVKGSFTSRFLFKIFYQINLLITSIFILLFFLHINTIINCGFSFKVKIAVTSDFDDYGFNVETKTTDNNYNFIIK